MAEGGDQNNILLEKQEKLKRMTERKALPDPDVYPEKYMKKKYPDTVKYLGKWQRRYNWGPSLLIKEIAELLRNLAIHDAKKGKNKMNPGKQMLMARMWMDEAKRLQQMKLGDKVKTQNPESSSMAVVKVGDNNGEHVVTAVAAQRPQHDNDGAVGRDPPFPLVQTVVRPKQPEIETNPFRQNYPQIPDPIQYEPPDVGASTSSPQPPPYSLEKAVKKPSDQQSPLQKLATQRMKLRHRRPRTMLSCDPLDPFDVPSDDDTPDLFPNPGYDPPFGTYPMIELPNPRAGADNQPPTVRVYRTWTDNDIAEAIKGMTSLDLGPEPFVTEIQQLVNSYFLNGAETQRVLQKIFKLKWTQLRGTFEPNEGDVPKNAEQVITELNKANGLIAAVRERYRVTPDYQKIQQCKQSATESMTDYQCRMTEVFTRHSGLAEDNDNNGPYQQQLKKAILDGMREEEQKMVKKQMITFSRASVTDLMDHACHAERIIREKKKKEATKVFLVDGAETYVTEKAYFRRQDRSSKGRGQNKFQRRMDERPSRDNQKETDRKKGQCYICHKLGHLARNCPKRRQDNTDSEDDRDNTRA